MNAQRRMAWSPHWLIHSAAAALLALALRRRVHALRRQLHSSGTRPTRLFLVRHAERMDHASPEWAAHAARAHDSPLSDAGFEQARRSGVHLRGRIRRAEPLYVRSSPLIRCVQTAACLTESLGVPTLPVQIDDALCELEKHLRPRMMGTHRLSVPPAERTAVARTSEGAPRGVCQPVLLRPGDLLAIHRHVDQGYRGSVCPVDYCPTTGVELHALTRQPQSADERCRVLADGLAALAPPGATTVLVTHGAFARMLGRQLLGEDVAATWGDFGYAEVAELVCDSGADCGPGRWRVARARFAPEGDAGRGRNA